MKTVQEYLRQADRKKLLDSMEIDAIYNLPPLLEYADETNIRESYRERLNGFIDHLLSLEPVPSDHMVLYMTEAYYFSGPKKRTLCLIDLNEVRKDIYSPNYTFSVAYWRKSLGYLVADNKLTQDYMNELLLQFLETLSLHGTDPEQHREKVIEILEREKQNKGILSDQENEEIKEELGLPIDEKDEKQDRLRSEVMEGIWKYERYCDWRERSRILKSLGEAVPSFEEET